MTPATRALILALLEKHGPRDVHAMMVNSISGDVPTYTAIRNLRGRLLEKGAVRFAPSKKSLLTVEERRQREILRKRAQRQRMIEEMESSHDEPPVLSASEGSYELHRATERMFERIARERRSSIAAVSFKILHSDSFIARNTAKLQQQAAAA